MRAIEFPGMTHRDLGGTPIQIHEGGKVCTTAWMPTKEELETLNEGGPIFVTCADQNAPTLGVGKGKP